jgi:outer membrane receptor protein involved in Fe transport
LIRRQARNLQSAFPYGDFEFGLATDTTHDQILASTLAGAFDSTSYNADYGAGGVVNTPDYRTWEPSFFAQDNWKISPKLTVTYGIRYDVYTPFTEAHNKISNFDFNSAVQGHNPEAAANAALKVAMSTAFPAQREFRPSTPALGRASASLTPFVPPRSSAAVTESATSPATTPPMPI